MTGPGADFLSLIAAKAVGGAPLVEPRLLSRFEPRPGGPDDLRQAGDELLEVEVETRPTLSFSAPSSAPAQGPVDEHGPKRLQAAEPADGSRSSPRGRAKSAARREAEAEPLPPARAAPSLEALSPPVAPPAEAPGALADIPLPALVPPARLESRERSETSLPPSILEPMAARGSDRASRPGLELAAGDEAPPARLEAPFRAPHSRAAALDVPMRRAEVRPRPTRGESRAAESAQPPRPPVVNITIGRVEVRAPAAEPVPRPRPAQPSRPAPQSLADYLKKRGGRR